MNHKKIFLFYILPIVVCVISGCATASISTNPEKVQKRAFENRLDINCYSAKNLDKDERVKINTLEELDRYIKKMKERGPRNTNWRNIAANLYKAIMDNYKNDAIVITAGYNISFQIEPWGDAEEPAFPYFANFLVKEYLYKYFHGEQPPDTEHIERICNMLAKLVYKLCRFYNKNENPYRHNYTTIEFVEFVFKHKNRRSLLKDEVKEKLTQLYAQVFFDQGHPQKASEILDDPSKIYKCDYETVLRQREVDKKSKVEEILENAGIKMQKLKKHSNSLLIGAIYAGYPKIIKPLVDEGAYVDAQKKDGETALMSAIKHNESEVVKILLDAGADLNTRDSNGLTALMWAVKKNNTEITRRLLEAGANVDAQDKDDKTALMWAVENNYSRAIKILIDAGADVNAEHKDGESVLMLAASYSESEVVKTLLDAGAEVHARNSNDLTALMYAADRNHANVIKTLVNAGTKVNAQDHDDNTALMYAADEKDPEVVKALIDSGAKVNIQNKKSWTALMYAAKRTPTPEIVKIILDAGADAGIRNKEGQTAADLAKTNSPIKNSDVYSRLQQGAQED